MTSDWVPEACTLPTVEQPLRRREFDDLFRYDVRSVVRTSPTRTRLDLRPSPEAAERAAGLAVRETGCCSFFSFGLAIADGTVAVEVATSEGHADVLAALTERAEALAGSGS
ncbi:hypothetical protein [Nocardioides humi]|uniref:Arsenate reductase n=1 Tax=Nocardioides humi TaxID=449461 RepID=A0ABN1ZXL4_9ACTN|nr:hypothetical protein [Nocardioides humi]